MSKKKPIQSQQKSALFLKTAEDWATWCAQYHRTEMNRVERLLENPHLSAQRRSQLEAYHAYLKRTHQDR